MKIAVIGSGQVGSRHLQSLANMGGNHEFHAVDPSPESETLARERLGTSAQRVTFHRAIETLPRQLDLVVVATNASVRRRLVTALLAHSSVRHLLLEKVLFQSVADCLWAADFLPGHGTRTWVNFPRRLQPVYRDIHAAVSPGQPIEISVTGSQWGLATSAVHFLDLVLFLTGSPKLDLNVFQVQRYPSPRHRDCFECTGQLKGTAGAGQAFTITAWPDGNAPIQVSIETPRARWIVAEGENQTVTQHASADRQGASSSLTQPFHYQSQLTATVAENLFATGGCDLTDLAGALPSHLPFLRSWATHFNPGADPDLTLCPVT